MNARHRGVSTETRTDLDAEGPLRRWARRKREVARQEKAEDEARAHDEHRDASEAAGRVLDSTSDASEPDVVEEKVLTDEDMPPLESLDENSDYSGFLSSGVSESLRRRALRKLFSSAVFNIPDGLDDYDDDFTSFAALGDIVTSDMKHQAEVEAERAKQAQARAAPSSDLEEGAREAGDERPVPASDDTTVRAEAGPDGATEPSGPAALPDSAPPDAVAEEDATGGGERTGLPVSAGRDSRDTVAEAGALADTETPDDIEATGQVRAEAAAGRGATASSGHPEDGSHAPAGDREPAETGEVQFRGA